MGASPIATPDDIDLRRVGAAVRRRWWVIGLSVVATTLAGVALWSQRPTQYQSAAEVLLEGSEAERRLNADGSAQLLQQQVETEMGVMRSAVVRQLVAEELGHAPSVSIEAVPGTNIVRVIVTADDPEVAAAGANAFADTYVTWRLENRLGALDEAQTVIRDEMRAVQERIDELEQPIEELRAQLVAAVDEASREAIAAQITVLTTQTDAERTALQGALAGYRAELSSLQVSQRISRTGGAQVISPAAPNDQRLGPGLRRDAGLGALSGLMLGAVLVFGLDAMDDRVRSRREVEATTGWSTVAAIPSFDGRKRRDAGLPTLSAPDSVVAEAYRSLRTSLEFAAVDQPLRAIQITSPRPGDGKTTTAANVAVTMARTGRSVILLDADLRRPRLHELFGLDGDVGFTSLLLGEVPWAKALQPTELDTLRVIAAGPPPPDPAELLGSDAAARLTATLVKACDVLVVDSPPLLAVTDPLVISRWVDGVIVVVSPHDLQLGQLERAQELLDQTDTRVIGTCLNRVDGEAGGTTYYSGYQAR